jgi:hypothetical protein
VVFAGGAATLVILNCTPKVLLSFNALSQTTDSEGTGTVQLAAEEVNEEASYPVYVRLDAPLFTVYAISLWMSAMTESLTLTSLRSDIVYYISMGK